MSLLSVSSLNHVGKNLGFVHGVVDGTRHCGRNALLDAFHGRLWGIQQWVRFGSLLSCSHLHVKLSELGETICEPLPVPCHKRHVELRGSRIGDHLRTILDESRVVQVKDLHTELDLRQVVMRDFSGHDLASHRAFNLQEPWRQRDAIGAAPEESVLGMDDETEFQDGFVVLDGVEIDGLVFVFLPCIKSK